MNEELLRAQDPGYDFEQSPEMLFEEGDEAGHDEEAKAASSASESDGEDGSSSRAESQPSQAEETSDPSEESSSKHSTRIVEFDEED